MTGTDLRALIRKHPTGFGALLVCVICGGLVYYRGSEITERTRRSEETAKKAREYQTNITNATNLSEQAEAMQAAGKELESRLVRPTQIALNLQYFYRMESDTGVKILDVRQNYSPAARTAQRRPATAYVPVPYTVSVQGTFSQTLLFLKKIEAGPRMTRFSNVTFTKAGGSDSSDGSSLMTLSINLELLGQP